MIGRKKFVVCRGDLEINSPLDWQSMKDSKRLGCSSPSVLTCDQRVLDPLEFGKVRCRGTDEWNAGILEMGADEGAGNALGGVIGEIISDVS